MYHVVLVSSVRQSDSVIHVHVSILFQVLFPYCRFFFFFLITLGLHCCCRAFSSYGEKWLLSAVVCGLLFAVAPLMVEHGLQ